MSFILVFGALVFRFIDLISHINSPQKSNPCISNHFFLHSSDEILDTKALLKEDMERNSPNAEFASHTGFETEEDNFNLKNEDSVEKSGIQTTTTAKDKNTQATKSETTQKRQFCHKYANYLSTQECVCQQGMVGNGTHCEYDIPNISFISPNFITKPNQELSIIFDSLLHSSLKSMYCKIGTLAFSCPIIGNQMKCKLPYLKPDHYLLRVSPSGYNWSNAVFFDSKIFNIQQDIFNILAFVVGFVIATFILNTAFTKIKLLSKFKRNSKQL